MDKDYLLFDFQSILEILRKEHSGNEKFDKLMEDINENSVIEDMPFYENYLSRFDVEKAFDGFNLLSDSSTLLSRDDLFLLFRLIFASFSSTYTILYDKPTNSIDLSVSVESKEQTITKKISDMWFMQIINLFKIYVDEQINYFISITDPDEIKYLKDEQKLKGMVFEKKVRQVRDMQDTTDLLSDLDDLLNQ